MKQLIGGVIGALAAGVLVTAWNARDAASDAAWTNPATAGQVRLVSNTAPAPLMDPAAAPLSVQCEPGQRAILRQVPSAVGTTTEAACVTDSSMAVAASAYGPGLVTPQPRLVPAAYTVPETVAPQRVVYRERPVRRAKSGRNWKKTALVIGGSTGVGAGVGAMAGGKKGALIGAAIGGGAATLYEAVKR
jgi:hypothetical protein